MRIKSGQPQGTNKTAGAKGSTAASKASAAKFSGLVQATGDATEDHKRASEMLRALAELASEVEAGKATKEDASRRFVGLVIQERFGGAEGKGGKNMEEAVADLVEADPQFVARLHSQLKRLAKS